MREILFKAKIRNSDKWVRGYYANSSNFSALIFDMVEKVTYEVDPDTVCQYTGLTDKNGTKIFENDIVTSAEFCPDNEGYGVIQWHDDEAMFVVEADYCYYDFDHIFGAELEVIGNVFDNLELIKGVEEGVEK